MISVTFKSHGGVLRGFKISGHSDYSEQGSDIVCAAVSSAAIMAANTVTEIQRLNAEVAEKDGFLKLDLSQNEAEQAGVTLDGLRLHLNALAGVYPQYITVNISEV